MLSRESDSNKPNMREWRNWQTRTFEGRVVYTVRVQVPFLAPEKSRWIHPSAFFCSIKRSHLSPRLAEGECYGSKSRTSTNNVLST